MRRSVQEAQVCAPLKEQYSRRTALRLDPGASWDGAHLGPMGCASAEVDSDSLLCIIADQRNPRGDAASARFEVP